MDGNRHKETAQRAPSGRKENWKENYTLFKQNDLYKIPELLVEEIMTAVNVVCFTVGRCHALPLDILCLPLGQLLWRCLRQR
jgi:hypothetical protein